MRQGSRGIDASSRSCRLTTAIFCLFVVGHIFTTVLFRLDPNISNHKPTTRATTTRNHEKEYSDVSTAESPAGYIRPSHTTVIYSGPTNMEESTYDENFRFFLRHGLPCSYKDLTHHDHQVHERPIRFVFVLTSVAKRKYGDYIRALNQSSCGNDLHILIRENRCYDMESARIAFHGSHRYDVLGQMDHVIFVNCGLLGPLLHKNITTPKELDEAPFWTESFTDMIDDKIKLSGLTFNCGGKKDQIHAHIQSMLWATDRTGLQRILASDAIYDCGDQLSTRTGRDELIARYEMGLSRAIMKAGYGIASHLPTQPGIFVWDNATEVVNATKFPRWCRDLWFRKQLKNHIGNDGLLFYKRSREYPDELDNHVSAMDTRWETLWSMR